jgi:hypothetical protein
MLTPADLSVVIHAEDRFSGKNSRPVMPSAAELTPFSLMRTLLDLNALAAMCSLAVCIRYSPQNLSEKKASNGLKKKSLVLVKPKSTHELI